MLQIVIIKMNIVGEFELVKLNKNNKIFYTLKKKIGYTGNQLHRNSERYSIFNRLPHLYSFSSTRHTTRKIFIPSTKPSHIAFIATTHYHTLPIPSIIFLFVLVSWYGSCLLHVRSYGNKKKLFSFDRF